MRIAWTDAALRDLAAARAFITLDQPLAAARQIELVVVAAGRLAQFPNSGRPGRRAGMRELVVGCAPYVLPYRLRGDVVEILRVLHGRQRWPGEG